MHPIKYLWGVRALFYKLLFGKIGNSVYIGKPIIISGTKKISIGNRVRIYSGIRLEAIGAGSVIIGDNVSIQQNVHITALDKPIIIKSDTTIAANAMITNSDHNYNDITKSVLEQGNKCSETVIGKGCFIGYGAVLLAGTVLGEHCVVGANTVVRGHYPDYCVITGCPGKAVKKYNTETKKWVRV